MKDMTVRIDGKDILIKGEEFHKVFSQMQKASDREEIRETLACRSVLYSDGMLDHLAENLWDELWNDEDFAMSYDNTIQWMADNYVTDLKRMLTDKGIKFAQRQRIRTELRKLGEIA